MIKKLILGYFICLFYATSCFAIQSKENVGTGGLQKEVVLAAKATASAPSWIDTATVPLSVDTTGSLRITGAVSGRTLTGSSTYADIATATTTQLIALSGTTQIKVYGFFANVGNGQVLTFKYGTGTNCGTGTTSISHGISFANGAGTMGIISAQSPNYPIFITPAGQALCVTTGSAVANTGVTVSYIQE